jgi:hypothetical protein
VAGRAKGHSPLQLSLDLGVQYKTAFVLQHKNPRSARRCRAILIAREKGGKTLPFVFKTEPEALETLDQRIEVGSIVRADEATHWDALHSRYLTKPINHQEAYFDGEACTNAAESFFSRLRRSEIGIHHHIAGPYLNAHASETAWREDNRRRSNGEQYLIAVNAALAHPVSR